MLAELGLVVVVGSSYFKTPSIAEAGEGGRTKIDILHLNILSSRQRKAKVLLFPDMASSFSSAEFANQYVSWKAQNLKLHHVTADSFLAFVDFRREYKVK